jgi:hypothetical protein
LIIVVIIVVVVVSIALIVVAIAPVVRGVPIDIVSDGAVLRVGGVTVVGAGSPDGFLLGRDLLL